MLLILLVYTLLWNKYPQLHSSTIKSLVLILKPYPWARLGAHWVSSPNSDTELDMYNSTKTSQWTGNSPNTYEDLASVSPNTPKTDSRGSVNAYHSQWILSAYLGPCTNLRGGGNMSSIWTHLTTGDIRTRS